MKKYMKNPFFWIAIVFFILWFQNKNIFWLIMSSSMFVIGIDDEKKK